MEVGSPDWLTSQFEKFRTKFEATLSESAHPTKRLFFVLLLLIASFLIYAYTLVLYKHSIPDFVVLKIDKLYFFYPAIALLSLLIAAFYRALNSVLSMCLFFISVLIFISLDSNLDLNISLFNFYIALLVSTIVLFYSVRSLPVFYRRMIAFLFFFGVVLVEAYLGHGWTTFESLRHGYPQRFLFVIFLAFTNDDLNKEENSRLFIRTILFPMHFLYPLPTQPYYWETMDSVETRLTRTKGVIDLFLCSLLTFSLFLLQDLGPMRERSTIQDILIAGTRAYLLIYLYSCVSISLPVAIGRILGFALPSAYRLPLLAASPQDRWRRWNTYFYNFYCWLFYIPFFKKTKSLFISVMLTFVLTSLFHMDMHFILKIFDYGSEISLPRVTLRFFILHGLVVYAGLIWNSKYLNGRKLSGWAGVALTWLAMIFIHSIRF